MAANTSQYTLEIVRPSKEILTVVVSIDPVDIDFDFERASNLRLKEELDGLIPEELWLLGQVIRMREVYRIYNPVT